MPNSNRQTMLEELQTLALVGLLVSTYYLTIGCRRIGDSFPTESTNITDKITGATEVLDDIADILDNALQSLGGSGESHPPSSPFEAILTSFIGNMTSKTNHAAPTLTQEWPIHQDDSPPTLETENQLD